MVACRRLRRGRTRAPKWVLTLPATTTDEQAKEIKRLWQQAGREGVAAVSEQIKITRLR
jgi:hypothetical protein